MALGWTVPDSPRARDHRWSDQGWGSLTLFPLAQKESTQTFSLWLAFSIRGPEEGVCGHVLFGMGPLGLRVQLCRQGTTPAFQGLLSVLHLLSSWGRGAPPAPPCPSGGSQLGGFQPPWAGPFLHLAQFWAWRAVGEASGFFDPHPRPGFSPPPAPGESHLMLWEAKAPAPSALHPAGQRGPCPWAPGQLLTLSKLRPAGLPAGSGPDKGPAVSLSCHLGGGFRAGRSPHGGNTPACPAGRWRGCHSARNWLETGPGRRRRWAGVWPQACF